MIVSGNTYIYISFLIIYFFSILVSPITLTCSDFEGREQRDMLEMLRQKTQLYSPWCSFCTEGKSKVARWKIEWLNAGFASVTVILDFLR